MVLRPQFNSRKIVTLGVTFSLVAVMLGASSLFAPKASAQTVQDVLVRDQLIADQEALLNVYRCRFNIDTQVVPGGCTNGAPTLPAAEPVPFGGTATSEDIAARDNLVEAQESLLNVYRCRFNIDTQLVPGGCATEEQPTPVPNEVPPDSTGDWELVRADAEWVDLRLFASSTENYSGDTPYMYVSCNQGEDVAIYFWFPDTRLNGAVAYWLNDDRESATTWDTARGDNNQAVRYDWRSSYREPLGASRNQDWMKDTLFEMIENPGTFKIQVDDGSEITPRATFHLVGLPEAVVPVRDACGILPEPSPDPVPPGWELVRADANAEWVDLRLFASSTENYSGNRPYMYVSCNRGEDVAIYFWFPDERLEGAIAYWLNGTQHSATTWDPARGNYDQAVRYDWRSSYREPLGASRNQDWMKDTLFEMIENPGTFVLQADDGTPTSPTATFNLAGLPEAVVPVRDACGILPEPSPDPVPPGWELVRDNAEWVDLRLFASSTENYSGNRPYMYVSCNRGEDVAIYFWFPDERLEGAIAYWLNGTQHSATTWDPARGNYDQAVRYDWRSSYREPLGASRNQDWMKDTLFEMIENPGTFVLQADDGTPTSPTATFNLAGLPEAVGPVRDACGI